MNKRQKEVLQSQLDSEKAVIKQLEKQYKAALKDINEKVKLFDYDINMLDEAMNQDDLDNAERAKILSQKRSKAYQKQYQEALEKQLEGILEKLHSDEYATLQQYLNESYNDAFLGTVYDLHGQGIPLVFPINQAAAVKAILTDSKISKGLYTSLGVDVNGLKKSISAEITRGIASGLTYNDIARNISNVSNAPLSRAKVIARTEAHRIQQASTMDAQHKAKEKGADVVKMWDAALDGATRPMHRELDGQIREIDEPYSVHGKKAQAPGHFGDPAEDCNCRCVSLTRAKWALDEDELQTLKERAEFFGLDKTKDFEDFKKKYLTAVDKMAAQPENNKTIIEKQSEKSAKTIKKIAEKLGVDEKEIKISELPMDAQEHILSAISQSIDRFPKIKGHIKGIVYDKDLTAIAESRSLAGYISVSNRYMDMAELEKKYAYQVRLQQFPKGTTAASILTHEIGHQIDGLFTIKGLDGGMISQYGSIRTSQSVKREIMERLGMTAQKLQEIRKEYIAKGLKGKDATHAVMFESKEFIKKHISEYAATNEREFFAECYSEYMTSENPREAAMIFGEILERLMGELK